MKRRERDAGVNLGNLYLPIRAVEETPIFSHTPAQSRFTDDAAEPLHVALIKIRAPQSVDGRILQGVGHTLSQLARLGLSCVVVVDPENGQGRSKESKLGIGQADRIVDIINSCYGPGARRVDSAVGVSPFSDRVSRSLKLLDGIRIMHRDQLLAPLRRGMIPVIAPVGFDVDVQRIVRVVANDVVLALTREFAGLQSDALAKGDAQELAEKIITLQQQVSIDRIIILDPLGGIPATDRMQGAHVFINLEQEFEFIKRDLEATPLQFIKAQESSTTEIERQDEQTAESPDSRHSDTNFHVKNLELLRDTLALLPPSSSAFLTTPEAVANSQSRPPLASEGPRVQTRRQRNPLIHNLLTDKPVFSSSLPSHRSPNPVAATSFPAVSSSPATFFKRGMPVSIVPDPLEQAWTPPSPSHPSIDLSDPRIDLPRLIYLIEDSFNRKLDVAHYLARVKDRIAGVIIAGEYEGGALLTWETPPGFPTDDRSHMVPYLDKFAVLKRSQGAGGVADIVFKTMVRDCFPNGVCWRSRMDNPVNKWYFERARGSWKMPGTNWTMFWTTDGVEGGDGAFLEYEAICKSVVPSWADKKGVVD